MSMRSIINAARGRASAWQERAAARQSELERRLEGEPGREKDKEREKGAPGVEAIEAPRAADDGLWALYRLALGSDSVSKKVGDRLAEMAGK